jgi:hypothetical protein
MAINLGHQGMPCSPPTLRVTLMLGSTAKAPSQVTHRVAASAHLCRGRYAQYPHLYGCSTVVTISAVHEVMKTRHSERARAVPGRFAL